MLQVKDFKDGFENGKKAFWYIATKKERDIDYMKHAIDMAKLSTAGDKGVHYFFGKEEPQPKIGAILVINYKDKKEKKVICTCRSALKDGDHAEFTAMETLAEKEPLEDSVLYTTLEPCTPESRHKSESCSEVIMNRRVKTVYIGTLDGNPLVFGRGVKYLMDKGIDVRFFDISLRDELKKINEEFFNFCSDNPDVKTMKKIDDCFGKQLNLVAVRTYLKADGNNTIAADDDERLAFYRIMLNKGQIIKGDFDGQLGCTKDFALAFINNPSSFVPGCHFGIIDKRKDDSKRKRIYVPYLELLNDKSNDSIYKSLKEECGIDVEKIENEDTKTALREMIANALVHTDYSKNIGPSIYIDDDYLSVLNYSNHQLKAKNGLKDFNYSMPVNPALMEFLLAPNLVESTRLGFNTIQRLIDEGIDIKYETDSSNMIVFKIALSLLN